MATFGIQQKIAKDVNKQKTMTMMGRINQWKQTKKW